MSSSSPSTSAPPSTAISSASSYASYRVCPVHDASRNKIICCAAWNECVIVSLSDGSIRCFDSDNERVVWREREWRLHDMPSASGRVEHINIVDVTYSSNRNANTHNTQLRDGQSVQQTLTETALILTIVNGQINQHALPTMRKLTPPNNNSTNSIDVIKNCHLVALNQTHYVTANTLNQQQQHIPLRACISLGGRNKLLLFYQWNDTSHFNQIAGDWENARGRNKATVRLIGVFESVVPEYVSEIKCIEWCGDNVAVGFIGTKASNSGYAMVDTMTGQWTYKFNLGRKAHLPVCTLLNNTAASSSATSSQSSSSSSSSSPSSLSVLNGRDEYKNDRTLKDAIMLIQDERGICIDFDGNPARKEEENMVFSDIPVSLCYSAPYVIACLPNKVEVRNIRTGLPAQTEITRDSARWCIRRKTSIFVIGTTFIRCFFPIPLRELVDQFMSRQQYRDALALVTMSDELQWKNRTEREQRLNEIMTLHAYELFNKGDYRNAMKYFQQSNADPRAIISLFPDVLPSKTGALSRTLQQTVKHPVRVTSAQGEQQLLDALAALIPYLARMQSMLSLQQANDANAANNNINNNSNSNALPPAATTATSNTKHDDDMPDDDEEEETASEQKEGQHKKKANNNPNNNNKKKLSSANNKKSSKTNNAAASQQQQQQHSPTDSKSSAPLMPLATLIDTVLLKAYLLTDISLLPILQQPNQCDLEECANILNAYEKFEELVCLYQSRGHHREALELLATLGQRKPVTSDNNNNNNSNGGSDNTTNKHITKSSSAAANNMIGVEPTVRYLQWLSMNIHTHPQSIALILEFSVWVFQVDPLAGLSIFTYNHLNPNQNQNQCIPPLTVLEHLKKVNIGDTTKKGSINNINNNNNNNAVMITAADTLSRRITTRDICIGYLESLITHVGETGATFHNELIFMYLDSILKLMKETEQRNSNVRMLPSAAAGDADHAMENDSKVAAILKRSRAPHRASTNSTTTSSSDIQTALINLRRKLIDFLRKSVYYTPEKMLSRFPRHHLLEERAILLSRINQHTAALTIIAHKLRDPIAAELYCQTFAHANGGDEKQDMYVTLLQVYLKPIVENSAVASASLLTSSGSVSGPGTPAALSAPQSPTLSPALPPPPMVEPALSLVSRHYKHIDPLVALSLLPASTTVKSLQSYLTLVIRHHRHTARQNTVVKNLLRAEHMTVRRQWLECSRTRIAIDDEVLCAKCAKKIGQSAFARFPNGVLMHYVCYNISI